MIGIIKKIATAVLAISVIACPSISNRAYALSQEQDTERAQPHSLIEVLENTQITSRAELQAVLNCMGINNYSVRTISSGEEVYFDYNINYEENVIEIDTIYQTRADSYTTSGRATREVCDIDGNILYTLVVTGTFVRTEQTCAATSVGGSFTPGANSSWRSTPSYTRGSVSRIQAYTRISGVATSGSSSKNYNLTLYCDYSGYLSSSFSG